MPGELRVVATAGHVDHGKSSLIVRLTGIDPDRWAEEKRRGLTIDLGYAWCTLPSGREIGFVDVPGHERFIGNMLAGVGPVRLVLFVVAADEGWKPQSEEHLQILDVLGVRGGVIALTKRDLVDDETLDLAAEEIRERVAGTGARGRADRRRCPPRPASGIDALAAALDAMLDRRGPRRGRARSSARRPRVHDQGCRHRRDRHPRRRLPARRRRRRDRSGGRPQPAIRSLQTHKQSEDRACPVSRVAANLVGVERDRFGTRRGARGTRRVAFHHACSKRACDRYGDSIAPVTTRGAFKLHVGAAEVDARMRLYGTTKLETGDEAFVRITVTTPVVLDVGDRFVLRESGRGETVAGGDVLDVSPPTRAGADPITRLRARAAAARDDLPALLVEERGAIRAADVFALTGSRASGGGGVGEWLVADALARRRRGVRRRVRSRRTTPSIRWSPAPASRSRAGPSSRSSAPRARPPTRRSSTRCSPAWPIEASPRMEATTVRLPSHRVALDERSADVDRLLDGDLRRRPRRPRRPSRSWSPAASARDVIDAAAREGLARPTHPRPRRDAGVRGARRSGDRRCRRRRASPSAPCESRWAPAGSTRSRSWSGSTNVG